MRKDEYVGLVQALLNTGAKCGRIYKWLDGSIGANLLNETGRFVKHSHTILCRVNTSTIC